MSSRIIAGVLAAGCLTAAAGGAYVAIRQNETKPVAVATPAVPAEAAGPAAPVAKPVSETEAVVSTPATTQPAPAAAAVTSPVPKRNATPFREAPAAPAARRETGPAARERQVVAPAVPTPAPAANTPAERPVVQSPPPAVEASQEVPRLPEPAAAAAVPQFEEVVLPAASVMGLQVDTALSSERARIEDRVDARVTRDVMADGRVAIPAGARVIGAVTLVERGGKVKQAARLGVRFHTLVLADGREIPLRTEAIYREGESPTGESARKIGGAAIGGAILGAIMGGGKGAVIGGATGAAGGGAVVMAGDRNAATLAPGTVVTVRLSAPATIEVEKRDPQS